MMVSMFTSAIVLLSVPLLSRVRGPFLGRQEVHEVLRARRKRPHEVRSRGHEGREQLRPQLVLAGHRRQPLDALGIEDALEEAALENELVLILGELGRHLRRRRGALVREDHRRRTLEELAHPLELGALDRELDERVFEDLVLALYFAELVAQTRDGRDVEPAVVRKHDRSHAAELVLQLVDLCFFGYAVHLPSLLSRQGFRIKRHRDAPAVFDATESDYSVTNFA